MKDLASFSIETDDIVLLTYADGTTRRARVDALPQLLSKPDLRRIKAAFRLRRRFHGLLPTWLRAVAVTVLLLTAGLGTMKVVSLVTSPSIHTAGKPITAQTTSGGRVLAARAVPVSTPTPPPRSSSVPPSGRPVSSSLASALAAAAPAPSPIVLPLGLSLPNPAPLVPDLARHITAPVTHALTSLGL